MVRYLLEKGVDIQAVSDGSRDTALHLAAMCAWEPRSLELTRLLLAAGCNPHLLNSRGETPLTIAVKREYISVVELQLSFNNSLPSDILLLVLPRPPPNPRTIQWLMDRGANVHAVTSSGDTVLHLAIAWISGESECLNLVERFINAGCDPTARDNSGKTVLEAALAREYTSVVEHLLARNHPVPREILLAALQLYKPPWRFWLPSTESEWGTVLHLAITRHTEPTSLDLVKRFIDAGCNPTTCNARGNTVLEAALERRYTSVVEYLLARNHPLPHNILSAALQHRSTPQIVQALLCKGANVHSTTSEGDTILHLAIARYQEPTCLDLVARFINAGRDPTTCNAQGETVLEAALERRYTSVVEHLLACHHTVPREILLAALQVNTTPQIVQALLCKGANVHSTTSEGDTLLHLAIARYQEPTCLDLVKRFNRAGCNPAVCNAHKESVLAAAIARRYTSVVEYLLSCNVPGSLDILESARQRYREHNQFNAFILPSPFDNEHYQRIVELLNAADKAGTTHSRPEDKMPAQVAKRPRMRYVEITLPPPPNHTLLESGCGTHVFCPL